MAYVFNAISGQIDDINPLSTFSASGDFQIGNPAIISKDLFGFEGVKYYMGSGGGGGGFTSPNIGQPIPIGMGLTMLYSQGFSPVIQPVNIKTGQPIPIGMGLTQTYAQDIT